MPHANPAKLVDMHNLLRAVCALAMAGCAAHGTSRQQTPQPAPPIEAPLKLCKPPEAPPPDVRNKPGYVQLAVSVTDASGKPIAELRRSDFVVETETQPLPIEFFRDDRNSAPTSLAIIVDASGSMEEKLGVNDSTKLESVRQALSDVTAKLDACDEVAILTFGGREANGIPPGREPYRNPGSRSESWRSWSPFPATAFDIRLLQPWTTDHKLAMSRLTDQVPYGRTPLYDSIHQGLQLLAAAHYPNRVLVLITDGMDTSSGITKDTALAEARQSRIPIYAVGLGDPKAPERWYRRGIGRLILGPGIGAERVDERTLKEFSEATGGKTFIVSSIDKDSGATFIAALATVTSIVGKSYAIGVTTPAARTAELPTISIANRPGAIIRARPIAEVNPTANSPSSAPK
jgi:hypothetical protein